MPLSPTEAATMQFEGAKPAQADYDMYSGYSQARLKMLAYYGDPVATSVLGQGGGIPSGSISETGYVNPNVIKFLNTPGQAQNYGGGGYPGGTQALQQALMQTGAQTAAGGWGTVPNAQGQTPIPAIAGVGGTPVRQAGYQQPAPPAAAAPPPGQQPPPQAGPPPANAGGYAPAAMPWMVPQPGAGGPGFPTAGAENNPFLMYALQNAR
jgi:hypothetical protein